MRINYKFRIILSLFSLGVYAFKCNEAEELFNVVKVATENSVNAPEVSLIDQINNHPMRPVELTKNVLCKPKNDPNNQTKPESSPRLPVNHYYANDIRYMNLNGFDSDNSPLLNQDFDFSESVNLNYAKLDDLQLQLNNLNNNHRPDAAGRDVVDYQNNIQMIMCQSNPLVGGDSIVLDAIKFGRKGFRPADLEPRLNYTTLALDSKSKPDDEASLNSTPNTPVQKYMKNGDLHTTSEPTTPASPNKQENIQQYSTIDFRKTKALNLVLNAKN